MRNVIITTLGLLAFSSLANAQSRPMPLLEMPVSAEALSIGNTLKGSQQSHYIFTNPSSMMQQSSKMNINYGLNLFLQKATPPLFTSLMELLNIKKMLSLQA